MCGWAARSAMRPAAGLGVGVEPGEQWVADVPGSTGRPFEWWPHASPVVTEPAVGHHRIRIS